MTLKTTKTLDFLKLLYKETYQGYKHVSLVKLQKDANILDANTQYLLNKALVELKIISFIGDSPRFRKYYWSHAQMPNILMANRVNEKVDLYKLNKSNSKKELATLKKQGYIPIVKTESIWNDSELAISNKPKKMSKSKSMKVYDHHKLVNHKHYNDLCIIIDLYKKMPLDGKISNIMSEYNLNPVYGTVMNKTGAFTDSGRIDPRYTADHLIACAQEYWKNKMQDINHFTDIKLANVIVTKLWEDTEANDVAIIDATPVVDTEEEMIVKLKEDLGKSIAADNKALMDLVNENVQKRVTPISLQELEEEVSKRQKELLSDAEFAWSVVLKASAEKIENLKTRREEINKQLDMLNEELNMVNKDISNYYELKPKLDQFINLF